MVFYVVFRQVMHKIACWFGRFRQKHQNLENREFLNYFFSLDPSVVMWSIGNVEYVSVFQGLRHFRGIFGFVTCLIRNKTSKF